MYRKQGQSPILPGDFKLTFEGKLSSDNRWIILANLIPWAEFEDEYSSSFSIEMGAPAKSFRMALEALIIKEKLGISDRETVEQIKENPYLQYFIGLSSYSYETPFDASMHDISHTGESKNDSGLKKAGVAFSVFGEEAIAQQLASKRRSIQGLTIRGTVNKAPPSYADIVIDPSSVKFPEIQAETQTLNVATVVIINGTVEPRFQAKTEQVLANMFERAFTKCLLRRIARAVENSFDTIQFVDGCGSFSKTRNVV